MMRTRSLALGFLALTAAWPSAARAAEPEAEKTLSSTAPDGALDPDFSRTLEAAEKDLSVQRPDEAMKLVLPLWTAPNRFSVAQRELLVPRSADVLRRAGSQLVSAGNIQLGLRAYDAAWQIDQRPDPAYGKALVSAAEQERSDDPAASLWLARRARAVAPDFERARERDEAWSRNRFAVYGYGLMLAGVAAAVAGLVFTKESNSAESELTGSAHDRAKTDELISSQRSFGLAAGVSLGAGAVAFASGVLLLLLGNPKETPRSPAYLPALKAAAR